MKNNLGFLLLFILLSVSCGRRVMHGEGSPVTQKTQAETQFNSIHISAPCSAVIHLSPGSKNSVQLSGYPNILDKINTRVENQTLFIEVKNNLDFETEQEIKADITTGSLKDLTISGAADVVAKGIITTGRFLLSISGAGNVSLDKIDAGTLDLKISGAGNVSINSGKVRDAVYHVSGLGNIEAPALEVQHATAHVSGAGKINLLAVKTLSAKVSGAGKISYSGKPRLTTNVSGIGSISANP